MFSFCKFIFVLVLICVGVWVQVLKFDVGFIGIGCIVMFVEIKVWDIDVWFDFKGLLFGCGIVVQGQDLWEGKCVGCYGIFGELNEVFSVLVGGIIKDDIVIGYVKCLLDLFFLGCMMLMKVFYISMLWDYIYCVMLWIVFKSLKFDEVYVVIVYLFLLVDVLFVDGELLDKNIVEVQQCLFNCNGKIWEYDMWFGIEFSKVMKFDVQGFSCMKDCVMEFKVVFLLFDFVMSVYGNFVQQQCLVGLQCGLDMQLCVKVVLVVILVVNVSVLLS